jgi:hypothetical protein
MVCYAPLCNRVFHSFCYDIGVLSKHFLPHFNEEETQHPYAHVVCKKECYGKAKRHYANMSADPEDRNIPWNKDGRLGENDPNNSENILIAWLQKPGNYAKFRSPPSGKTKVAVCEDISRTIKQADTLKVRKAPTVFMKIQAFEGSFRDAHDWVNNTGVGVLERDGQVTFEEAVKKRFMYYYDLLDVMSERSSARPRASTDTMNMTGANDDDDDDDSSSSSPSISVTGKDEEEEDDVSVAEKTAEAEEEEKEEQEEDDDTLGFPAESFPTPRSSPIAGATAVTAINSSAASSTVNSSLTSETETEGGGKRKEKTAKTSRSNKAQKISRRAGKKSRGSPNNPHNIDAGEDDSWQVSMLDIRRGEAELQQEKWLSQKQQHTMEVQLQQEKWTTQKQQQDLSQQQQNLEYKFDLMVKYKKLQKEGFDNHQIVKMIPDMRPIIDTANMPNHVHLTAPDETEEVNNGSIELD